MKKQKSKDLLDQKKQQTTKYNLSNDSKVNILSWIVLSIIFGYLHMLHIESLFENDKNYSYLSNLERELSFRTEAGLYYYYFKALTVDEDFNPLNTSLLKLVNDVILNDDRTEYPQTINSLQRFNLYPEILVAIFYRAANSLGLLHKTCWKVTREEDNMPPVTSCVGYLEPIFFYSKFIFVLHGFSMAFLFTLSWLINDKSILSGIISCLFYFYNHSEATRVMWVPALRESFSFPFLLLQTIFLIHLIKANKLSVCNQILLTVSTLIYLLPWQFSQFSLATQTTSLFATYALGFLSKERFTSIIKTQTIALIICFILMFANRMLMTSLFSSFIFSIWIILVIENKLEKWIFQRETFLNRTLKALGFFVLLIIISFIFKVYILQKIFQQKDDSHVWEIFTSKFDKNFRTFDTSLYTCAREFDFLTLESFTKLSQTVLLPIAFINAFFYLTVLIKKFALTNKPEISSADGVFLFNLFQLIAYTIIAILIMRLKLFWTPYLCIFASFIANNNSSYNLINLVFKFFSNSKSTSQKNFSNIDNKRLMGLILILSLASYKGIGNLWHQHSIKGQYSDYNMEKMIIWINQNTHLNDVFIGSMPTMANVKLSTNRPIASHPHYEDVELRKRIKEIYSFVYGYRQVNEVHELLKQKYRANYLVVEVNICKYHPPGKPECAMSHIVHLDMLKNSDRQACDVILTQAKNVTHLFKKVFNSNHLFIFKIL